MVVVNGCCKDIYTVQVRKGHKCDSSRSSISKIQIGFTFLVPAHPGSPGQMAARACN